jgi:hypothetical protein
VPAGSTLVNAETGQPIYTAPEKPDTAAQDKQHYEKIQTALNLKQPVSAEDLAFAKAYEKEKTLVPVANFTMNQPQRADARLDRSYSEASKEIENLRKPVMDRAERLARLEDSLNANSPQADALLAPELLSVMAGGQGSGLRMNEAEISRIVGGRSNWESLKAALNKWQLDPSKALSVTPAQRQQMRDVVRTVMQRNTQQLSAFRDASHQLIDAPDVKTHRQVVADLQDQLIRILNPGGSNSTPLVNPFR